jgi:hypothetical protein
LSEHNGGTRIGTGVPDMDEAGVVAADLNDGRRAGGRE